MDPAKFAQQKNALIDQINTWDGSDRGFSDIVRNALDLDPDVAGAIKDQYGIAHDRLRDWVMGKRIPRSFRDQEQYVDFIKGYFLNPA